MNPIDLDKLDRSLVMSCFDAMARCTRPHTAGEHAMVERQRKRTMRSLLKTSDPSLRQCLYQHLVVLTAMLGRRLPSLSDFPAPAAT